MDTYILFPGVGNLTSFKRDCDVGIKTILLISKLVGNLTSFKRDCDGIEIIEIDESYTCRKLDLI